MTVVVFVLSVKSVQQQDAGKYWCEVEFHSLTFSSEPAWITVEGKCTPLSISLYFANSPNPPIHSNLSLPYYLSPGVPHFTLEPQDVATFPGVPFNLTCAAVGPPDPVDVLWRLGGVQQGEVGPSPSVFHVNGKSPCNTLEHPCKDGKSTHILHSSRSTDTHV